MISIVCAAYLCNHPFIEIIQSRLECNECAPVFKKWGEDIGAVLELGETEKNW
jgi:hypothetical protein